MNAASSVRAPLWSSREARLFALLVGIAFVLVAASWFFAAGRDDGGQQMALVVLSLLGVAVGMAAGVGWVRRGRRAVGTRTGLLLGSAPGATVDAPMADALVAGPDAKWFHRADCLLVEGRNWPPAPASAHESAGRRACPACKP